MIQNCFVYNGYYIRILVARCSKVSYLHAHYTCINLHIYELTLSDLNKFSMSVVYYYVWKRKYWMLQEFCLYWTSKTEIFFPYFFTRTLEASSTTLLIQTPRILRKQQYKFNLVIRNIFEFYHKVYKDCGTKYVLKVVKKKKKDVQRIKSSIYFLRDVIVNCESFRSPVLVQLAKIIIWQKKIKIKTI